MMPNLTTVALLWIGASLLLLPLMIATVRLAVLPLMEAIAPPPTVASTEARLAHLEENVVRMGRELEELSAKAPSRRPA